MEALSHLHGVSKLPHFPTILSTSSVAELAMTNEMYDRFGPIFFSPCLRRTSLNRNVGRTVLISRCGTIFVLRPVSWITPGVSPIVDPSHVVPLALGGVHVRYFVSNPDNGREIEFQFTSSSSSLILSFSATDGSRLLDIINFFESHTHGLILSEGVAPFQCGVSASKLVKEKVATVLGNRSRSSGNVKLIGGNPQITSNSNLSTSVDLMSARPLMLQHFPPSQIVPLDVLKRRPPLTKEEREKVRRQLHHLYRFYCPEKECMVDDLMHKYENLEDLLLIKVICTYGNLHEEHRRPHETDSASLDTSDVKREALRDAPSRHNPMPMLHQEVSKLEEVHDEYAEREHHHHNLASGATDIRDHSSEEDDVEDLLLGISVLERACDRLMWAHHQNRPTSHDRKANAAAASMTPPSGTHFDFVAQQATAKKLGQLVAAVCAKQFKQHLLDEEEAIIDQ